MSSAAVTTGSAVAAGGASAGCPVAHQRMAQVVGLVEERLFRKGRLGRYTMEEVAQHNHKDSGWVVVNGRVSRRRRHNHLGMPTQVGVHSVSVSSFDLLPKAPAGV